MELPKSPVSFDLTESFQLWCRKPNTEKESHIGGNEKQSAPHTHHQCYAERVCSYA